MVILGLMIFKQILKLIKQKKIFDKAVYISLSYLLSFIFVIIFFGCFIHFSSFTLKNKCLEFIGSQYPERTRRDISFIFLKYSTVVNKNVTFEDVYRKIWSPNLNPFDPDSGWGTRIHKTVFPLTGKNAEIVPVGSKGYLMDSSCNSDTRAGNAYSYTIISNETVSVNKILVASVFCYVSTDFDGEWALISCEGATEGKKGNEYDLKLKGTWQKLILRVNCLEGNAPVYLYFSKFGVTDLSSLKGYVIYAFPNVEIREKTDSILPRSEKTIKPSSKSSEKKEIEKSKASYPFSKSMIGGNESTNYNNIPIAVSHGYASYNTGQITQVMERSYPSYIKTSILVLPLIFHKNLDSLDRDPIRDWFARIISEDTVYYGYSTKITINSFSNEFLNSRLLRWQFAWQIFNKEFNWKQKIFGGGFNFLNWYGFYFLKDKTLSDYPHNPFLSILLYSGIVGLILYLFLLYKVFYYYLKYIKEYYLFLIFFLITFFFSFFSGSSPFDPPIMGFFILLSFFFHSSHKNNNYTITEKLTNDKDSDHRD